MNYRELLRASSGKLSSIYDGREASNIMHLVIETIKGWNSVDLLMHMDDEVSDYISGKTEGIVSRLLANEPVQYILGETYWHGMKLKVTPDVLIPRPETSELVDMITDADKGRDLKVLDLCTGSGAIAIALSRFLDFPDICGIDISDAALSVARDNARSLHADVKFLKCDVLKPLPFADGEFDIIVSNPPYICDNERKDMARNVLDHEPAIALFVPDNDPMRFYRPIAGEGFRIARPGGKIYLEINPLYADDVISVLEGAGWTDVCVMMDMEGKKRFAKGTRS
ncbi:MAG: peptide chain release factor N(5)-glutamine methyltransferase [Muribaculaceae bacterium]|nr:peptide chain release factor N(5)-glutamine methyltransferase [Muribaculaceae bacterium]